MITLQDFLAAATVASGSGNADLGPALSALEAYVGNFEGGARRNALMAASKAVSIIRLEGDVRDSLAREIELRISKAPPMSL